MRKWLWIGSLSVVVLGCVVMLWKVTQRQGDAPIESPDDTRPLVQKSKNDGDAEASEVIEPLIVERWNTTPETPTPPDEDGPAPRVVLQPGMEQPPRPDEEPSKALRMPYAEE